MESGLKRPIDIIFVIDVTGGMANGLSVLKSNLNVVIENLDNLKNDKRRNIELDWRSRIVPFRDIEHDGADAIDNSNKFVNNVADLRDQIKNLKAEGEDDPEKSQLDALYYAIRKSDWRDRVKRCIVLFTDAPPREKMHSSTLEADEDDSVERLLHLFIKYRIKLFLFAPEHKIYKKFACIPGSEYTILGKPGKGTWEKKLLAIKSLIVKDHFVPYNDL